MSVPGGLDGQGLPLGLHLIGNELDEQIVLNAGLAIEERAGFTHGRRNGGECESEPSRGGRELDRRIDLINVVFGAALGGYIGDVLGPHTVGAPRLMLALALVILVCLLVAIRNLIHVLRGRTMARGSSVAGGRVGLAFFFAIRGDTYLDLSALVPVAVGWQPRSRSSCRRT